MIGKSIRAPRSFATTEVSARSSRTISLCANVQRVSEDRTVTNPMVRVAMTRGAWFASLGDVVSCHLS